MPGHPDGLAIARSRIAAEKETRTGFLDLGRLGLTELPKELFELEYLRGLNWGGRWLDEQGARHEAESDQAENQVTDQFARPQTYPGLTHLWLWQAAISDLAPLSGLTALRSPNCSRTPVAELPEAMVWLESLQHVYLFNILVIDFPSEVLSSNEVEDCLERLRAHLCDMESS